MYKKLSIFVALLGLLLFTQLQVAWAEKPSTFPSHTSESKPLADFIRLVISSSPRSRSVDASLQASSARYDAAGQPLYNPELELDAERSDIDTTSIGLSQAIDWSDKREAQVKVARSAHSAAIAEAVFLRQELAIELLKALGEYHTANAIEELGKERLQLMQEFAAIAEKRYLAGDLNQVELDLAKLASLEANLESAELRTRLSDAQKTLAALMGEVPVLEVWPTLPEMLPDIQQDNINVEKILQEHPLFRAKKGYEEVARSSIDLRQRETRPDPTISIRAGREDEETLTGLTLSVPLFVRNTYRAEVAEANAQLTQSQHDARDTWFDLKSQLDAAFRRYVLTHNTWKDWQQQGEASLRRRVELLEQLWQAGELGTTDYLVQLKQTLDTQGASTELRGRLWQAWSDWLTASGTVFQWLDIDPSQLDANATLD